MNPPTQRSGPTSADGAAPEISRRQTTDPPDHHSGPTAREAVLAQRGPDPAPPVRCACYDHDGRVPCRYFPGEWCRSCAIGTDAYLNEWLAAGGLPR